MMVFNHYTRVYCTFDHIGQIVYLNRTLRLSYNHWYSTICVSSYLFFFYVCLCIIFKLHHEISLQLLVLKMFLLFFKQIIIYAFLCILSDYIYYYSIAFFSYTISMVRTMAIDEDGKSFWMVFCILNQCNTNAV